jgi:hypothetical protein
MFFLVRSTNRSGRPGRRLVRFLYLNWWVRLSNPNNPTARPFLSSVEDNRILRIKINAHLTRYRGALGSFMEPGCHKLDGDHPPVRLLPICKESKQEHCAWALMARAVFSSAPLSGEAPFLSICRLD